MFGLGTWEIVIILIVALIFIGPDKLPQVAKSLGKGMRQVRSAMNQIDSEVRQAADKYVKHLDDDDDDAPAAPGGATAPVETAAAPTGVETPTPEAPVAVGPARAVSASDAGAGFPRAASSQSADTTTAGAPTPDPGTTPAAGDAATPAAGRDWQAHVAQPIAGRVAAAPPGRRVVRGGAVPGPDEAAAPDGQVTPSAPASATGPTPGPAREDDDPESAS